MFPTSSANTIATVDTLRLVRLPKLTEDFHLHAARAQITATAAAGFITGGIYTYDDFTQTPMFRLVPGTEVSFPTNTVARVEVILPNDVMLRAGQMYYMGGNISSATPTVVIALGIGTRLEAIRTFASSAAVAVPSSIPLSGTSASYTIAATPLILYISKAASRVV